MLAYIKMYVYAHACVYIQVCTEEVCCKKKDITITKSHPRETTFKI